MLLSLAKCFGRSISELCGADHLNDPVILGGWQANKTPEIVMHWIAQPGYSVLVAIESRRLPATLTGVAGLDLSAVPSGERRDTAPIEPLARLLTHSSGPLAPGVRPGEAHSCWRLRKGFTFGANARLKIAVGRLRRFGPAARVDEFGPGCCIRSNLFAASRRASGAPRTVE